MSDLPESLRRIIKDRSSEAAKRLGQKALNALSEKDIEDYLWENPAQTKEGFESRRLKDALSTAKAKMQAREELGEDWWQSFLGDRYGL